MRNEPNFQKSQMFIKAVTTTNYNEKLTMDTWSKRTQTKPILSTCVADKIALSEVEGPKQSRTNLIESRCELSYIYAMA
jgi:endonuclease/exonuclease/phosphatase family metal-dependent hydrolase